MKVKPSTKATVLGYWR